MRIVDQDSTQASIQRMLDDMGIEEIKRLLGLQRWRPNDMAWPLAKIISMIFTFHLSNTPSLKAFWATGLQAQGQAEAAAWPSYKTFHKWTARCGPLAQPWAESTFKPLRQRLGFIDSVKLPIGESYRRIKSMGRAAGLGHSSCGEYFGMKLHVLMDDRGHLCNVQLTPGHVHDLTPLKQGFLAGQIGKIYADKGYLSLPLHFELMSRGIALWACPRDNMGYATEASFQYVKVWRLDHAKMYKKRQTIERLFGELKGSFNLTLMGLRSAKMALSRVFFALLSRQWVRDDRLVYRTV